MNEKRKLKFTFLITNRSNGDKIVKYLSDIGFDKCFSFFGKGSASSNILDYLGIGETEKEILVYPSDVDGSNKIFEGIKNSEFIKNTIVFRVPVKGISSMKGLNYFIEEELVNE